MIIISRYCTELQKQPPRGVSRKKCSENMRQIHKGTPMPKWDFNKAASQLYWNHTSVWVFSCKFAEYFQKSFLKNTSGRLLLALFTRGDIHQGWKDLIFDKSPCNISFIIYSSLKNKQNEKKSVQSKSRILSLMHLFNNLESLSY